MPEPLLSCIRTTVRSQLETARYFSFLGPHGMRLEPNEQVTVPGDIWDGLNDNPRKFKGLETALAAGDIALVRTPESIIWDDTADRARTLKSVNGTLSAADPCWGSFVSAQT